jgi:hypothetical protein
VPKAVRQFRREASIIVKEPSVAFLPSLRSFAPKLLAKVLANQRMRIEMSRIMRIFPREELCSS